MSELALYRKYRPRNLTEVLGQEQVTSVLAQALKQENLVHAYLLAGPRGTGKTSVARILASELGVSDKDLIEIDGASNRGIDEIRALREAVYTLPFNSPYKVYIIDEVHMLTKDAFNALLKTLEEPPRHVIFVLATTELNKVLDTIISRCQTYIFKKPSLEILRKTIKDIARQEDFNLVGEVADLLAFMGDGSFRDTIGLLQKIISASVGNKISLVEVEKIIGAPNLQLVRDLVLAIADNNLDEALLTVSLAGESSIDFRIFIKLLLREIRLALLISLSPKLKQKILSDLGESERDFLESLSGRPGTRNFPSAVKEFLDIYPQISASFLPQVPLELALVRILC